MSDYVVSDTNLTSIANAIRTKGGTSSSLSFPTGFVNAIQAIQTGIDCPVFTVERGNGWTIASVTCDKTYSECNNMIGSDVLCAIILNGNSTEGYQKFGAWLENVESSTLDYVGLGGPVPEVKISYASNGTITAEEFPIPYKYSSDLTASNLTVIAPAGYYDEAASKTLTDSNLTAGNIKDGVSIFGVTGSYSGSGVDCPVFTISRSNGTITGIACNKTFAQCYDITATNLTAVFSESIKDNGAWCVTRYQGTLVYFGEAVEIPELQITYASDGTITWEENFIAYRSSSDLTANNLTVTAPVGYYTNAATKTLSDQNLVAGNIKNNVTIFGVTGSYSGAGIDCPIFTMVSNGTTGDPSSISCNKTYAECSALINNNIYLASAKWSDESRYFGGLFFDYDSNVDLIYDLMSYRIHYKSDGTITWDIIPGPTLITKTITANGTFNASSDNADGYSSVIVNVAAPTIALSEQSNTTGTTLIATGSAATAHSIYFEFSDSTNTTITVCYDDALIGTMITSYTPTTYSGKTVTLAQLDGVTWYQPAVIPTGVELVDFTACESNKSINIQGETVATEWYYTSDYTAVEQNMTFSYTASLWHYVAFYDSSHDAIETIYAYTDATVDPNDSNTGHGTLNSTKIPANAKYVRLCGTGADSSHISLIRTA